MGPKAIFPSIIKTRTKNKAVHPGEVDNQDRDGNPKQKRRSPAEMKEAHRQDELAKKAAAEHSQNAIAAAGIIEDSLREEDIARQTRPNHRLDAIPPFRPLVPSAAPVVTSKIYSNKKELEDQPNELRLSPEPTLTTWSKGVSNEKRQDNNQIDAGFYPNSGSESGDAFQPAEHPDTEASNDDLEDDVVVESEDEDDDETKFKPTKKMSKKGKYKPGRKDITAARKFVATVGTPATTAIKSSTHERHGKAKDGTGPPKKKSKKDIGGIVPGWESYRKLAPSTVTSSKNTSDVDDDSMVKQGGLVSDEERDDVERAAIAQGPTTFNKKGKLKLPNIVKISAIITSQPTTKKELRGGDVRWTTKHLPAGADKKFNRYIVNLAKLKAGTLTPWAGLDYLQVQIIVDKVFGKGEHKVEDGDVWCGLIAARLSNWRNAFAKAAGEAFKQFIKEHADDLKTPESIATLVTAYLAVYGNQPETFSPFWWREWSEDDDGKIRKKGMFQQPLIMYTLAHAHFVEYGDDVPTEVCDDDKPIGALILSLQAVEHTFKLWATGKNENGEGSATAGYFSFDNYGDRMVKDKKEAGSVLKVIARLEPRASRFLKTTKDLTEKHWGEIFAAANEFLTTSRKRKRSQSASSYAGSDVVVEPMPEYTFVSDSD